MTIETKTIYGAATVYLDYSTHETSYGTEYVTLEKVLVGHDELVELPLSDYWASLICCGVDHYWTLSDADAAYLDSAELVEEASA